LKDFIKILLFPSSLIFRLFVFIRNILYNTGIFKITKLSVPVISVGNVSAGGTGKTPMTLLIAEYYLKKGLKTGIISRGYGRKSRSSVLVFNGKEILCNVDECGDELFMIANNFLGKYSNCFIIANADRIEAARFLTDEFKVDVIVLDDAFQHRKVSRNLDIVMIDSDELADNNLFPSGRLREPVKNISRADLILINNKFSTRKNIGLIFSKNDKPVININFKSAGIFDYMGKSPDFQGKGVIAFCGIAMPDSFLDAVKSEGMSILDKVIYPDHHEYTDKDISYLKSLYPGGCLFITTEKDFVKLGKYADFLSKYHVYYLKIYFYINESDKFESYLDKAVKI